MLLLLLRVLLMMPLFVLSTADAGVVAVDVVVVAPASAGASGVASWLKRPQWRGVKKTVSYTHLTLPTIPLV